MQCEKLRGTGLGKLVRLKEWVLNVVKRNYDAELLAADQLDDRCVVGLEGVIRLAYWDNNGHRRLDVQGFAPSDRWGDLPAHQPPGESLTEAAQA